MDARVLLIAGLGTEVTISRRGRLLFKTADLAEAERTLARLLELVPSLAEGPGKPRGLPAR